LTKLTRRKEIAQLKKTRAKLIRLRIVSFIFIGIACIFIFLIDLPMFSYIFVALAFAIYFYVIHQQRKIRMGKTI